jgi:FkbM family methyltransferase
VTSPVPPARSRLRERLTYRLLIQLARVTHPSPLGQLWTVAWTRWTVRMKGSTEVRIHGAKARVNTGYAYPAFARRWPTYNDPLVELVQQVHLEAGRKVVVVDVGAAVGDTVLLVRERCPRSVESFHCVEADEEFFAYLNNNLGSTGNVRLYHEMLSDSDASVADLVRTHSGTASAQGDGSRQATTLDTLLSDVATLDVLKIDTDGFDGRVLAGATKTLSVHHPAVIFEWHPVLLRATSQDWASPFLTLVEHGYGWFIWFTKEGEFSHIDCEYDPDATRLLADLCLSGDGPRPDWHYDVVALPRNRHKLALEVAKLRHARRTGKAKRG